MPALPVHKRRTALNTQAQQRFSRQMAVPGFGESAQQCLAAARVLVVGVGGLGVPVVQYLAAAGVGTLGLVDDDVVQASNLPRQVIFTSAQVGQPKVSLAKRRLTPLNPEMEIITAQVRLEATNAAALLAGYDVIVDASDNFPTRYLLSDTAQALGVPVVWGAIFQTYGQVSTWFTPGVTLRDLYPLPPDPAAVPTCAQAGVLAPLCGQVGTLMASEVLRLCTGFGESLIGQVVLIDARTGTTRHIPLRPAQPVVAPHSSEAASTVTLAQVQHLVRRAAPAPVLIDVREPGEFAAGALPGARNIPLSVLPTGVPTRTPVVLYCHSGARAQQAASLMRAAKHEQVQVFLGGWQQWQQAHVAPNVSAAS